MKRHFFLMVLMLMSVHLAAKDKLPDSEPVDTASGAQSTKKNIPNPDNNPNVEKLNSEDPVLRRNAVIYLGTERDKKYFNIFKIMLDDPIVEVRRAAVNAIGKLNDKIAWKVLADKFSSESELNVKLEIVSNIGELRANESIDFLRNLLQDSYPGYRSEAVRALGKMADPSVYSDIVMMLNDKAEGVKVMAARYALELKIQSAVPLLIKNLKNPIAIVRKESVRALGEIGDPSSVSEIDRMTRDTDKSVRQAAQEALEKINISKTQPAK